MKRLAIPYAATLLALACAPSQHPPAQKDSPAPPNPCAEIVPSAQGLAAEGWGQQALDLLNTRCSTEVGPRAAILADMGRVKEADMLLADVAAGETAEARQLVANAMQKRERRKAAGGASEQYLETAKQLLEVPKCEEAVAAAEQAIRSNFPSPDAWFEKARAHTCLGQAQQARLAFERGLAESHDIPRWQRSPGIAVVESEWMENELLLLEEGAGAKAGWRVHWVKESWRLSKGPAPNHMVGHRLTKDLWQSGTSLFARTNGRTLEISVDFPVRAGAMNADRLVLIETQNYHRAPSFLHRFDLKTNEFKKRLQIPILVSVARVFLGQDWIAVSGKSGNDAENFETLLVLDAATGRLRQRLLGNCLPEFKNCYPGHFIVQANEEELIFYCDEVLPPGSDPIEIQGIASFQPKTGKVTLAYRPDDDVRLVDTEQDNYVALSSVDDLKLLEKSKGVWGPTRFDIPHRWHSLRAFARISDNRRHALVGGGWEMEIWDIEKKRREFRLNEEDSPDLGLTRSRSDAHHTWVQNCDTMLSLSWLEGADVRKLEGVPCSEYYSSPVWWTPPTANTSGIERRERTANSAASADIIAGEASIDGCRDSGLCSTLLYKGKRVFANSYQVPIGLNPNGQYAFFVHARERTLYARALPDGPILHKFPMETTKQYHVINVPNSTKALLWTDEGWRFIDLTDKPGQATSKLVQYSPTAQDITADMKLTVGAEGLCDEQGKCTPLEGLKHARTRQGNEQPVVVSTKKGADPDAFETVLRFAANGKLVTGTSPRQLHIWDAATGRYLGKYAVSSVGTWFFVAPGSGPQEERGVELLNVSSSEQETGLSCTVGDEWFPWEICEAHFRRDLLDKSGLPHSVRQLLKAN